MVKRKAEQAPSAASTPEKKQRDDDMDADQLRSHSPLVQSPESGVKTEPGTEQLLYEAGGSEMVDDLMEAIVPQQRGRKVGSGAGERRKATEAYSTNPHTMRARARQQKIASNPYRADLERATGRVNTWVSRKFTAWKASPAYQQAMEGVASGDAGAARRDEIEREKRDALKLERSLQDPASTRSMQILSLLSTHSDVLLNEISREQQRQLDQLKAQFSSAQADDWYFDEEDLGDDDPEVLASIAGSEASQLFGVNTPRDAFCDTRDRLFKDHEGMSIEQLQEAAIRRREARQSSTINSAVWRIAVDIVRASLVTLVGKSWLLDMLGPDIWEWNGADGSIERRQNQRWKLIRHAKRNSRARWWAGRHKATGFFSFDERRLLRAMWGASSDEWITLPGPASWWPDVTGDSSVRDRKAMRWYDKNGFGLPRYDAQAYQVAAFLIFMDKTPSPPSNWHQHMWHADGELAWDFDHLSLDNE